MKKVRNKKYVPKPVNINTIDRVISGFVKIGGSHLQTLLIKNHAALANMTAGRGTKKDFDLLAGAVNMAVVMSELGTGEQYAKIIMSGQDALHSCGKRFIMHGKFAFTGDELRAINDAMDVHDAQLAASRAFDVEAAYNEIHRRLRLNVNTRRIVDSEVASA
jgi:hypothetical protein